AEVYLEHGLVFPNAKVFRKALRQYCVQKKFDFAYLHNDKLRVQAQCMEECTFYIFASKMRKSDAFQIKHFVPTHACGVHYENTKCHVKFLVQRYMANFKDHLSWPTAALQSQIRSDYNIEVPIHRCYRAKMILRVNASPNSTMVLLRGKLVNPNTPNGLAKRKLAEKADSFFNLPKKKLHLGATPEVLPQDPIVDIIQISKKTFSADQKLIKKQMHESVS
ncbi:hypothetical protein CJ030_MR6G029207, partial [Morella rubra]